MSKRLTASNLPLVWLRLTAYVNELVQEQARGNKEPINAFADDLDRIAADDGFGTEGQCDPRGDQR